MIANHYDWDKGAVLAEHSKCKHRILESYFREYLIKRCENPNSQVFKLAIVDGFSGGGIYEGNHLGSPVIFARTLLDTVKHINHTRADIGMRKVTIHCFLLVNDKDAELMDKLKEQLASYIAASKEENSGVKLNVEYSTGKFEDRVEHFVSRVNECGYGNVIYNLDQYGYSHVNRSTITRLMNTTKSVEIFLTYAIGALLTYLSMGDKNLLNKTLRHLDLTADSLKFSDDLIRKPDWLGAIERAVLGHFGMCSLFTTPFSIHNPGGWRYWFMHFSNNYRARQVYNNVLHDITSGQAHYGRSGLKMLSYNPEDEAGLLYRFDRSAREQSRQQLPDDIARVTGEWGDTIVMDDFYQVIYAETPAHSDDIHQAIMENDDLEVLTPKGRERREPGRITRDDILRLKKQLKFYFS